MKVITIIFQSIKISYNATGIKLFFYYLVDLFNTLSPLLFSIIVALLIDRILQFSDQSVINNEGFSTLLLPLALLALVEGLKVVFFRIKFYLENVIYDDLESEVVNLLAGTYSSLSLKQLNSKEISNLFETVKSGHDWKLRSLTFAVPDFISNLISLIAALLIIVRISPLVSLIVLLFSLPTLIANLKYSSISWGIYLAEAGEFRKFSIIKAFLLEKRSLLEARINRVTEYFVNELENILSKYHKKRKLILKRNAILIGFTEMIRVVGTIASIYYLLLLITNGDITVANLILCISTLLAVSPSLSSTMGSLTFIYKQSKYMEKFLEFIQLKEVNAIGNSKWGLITEDVPEIEFIDLKFRYPQSKDYILKGINLKILPKENVAFVGENGAGKTTLINLLLGQYDEYEGEILIGGVNLKEISKKEWLDKVSLLTQHFNTYRSFDLKSNITLGKPFEERNMSKLQESIEKTGLTSFQEKLEKNQINHLSAQFENGADPSWGQWQRIGIARSFYRKTGIIIMDEPTSAIDAKGELEIFNEINSNTKDNTILYVSHRYSTVKNADRIVVLSNGVISESGTHEELMKQGGIYKENFTIQAKSFL